MTRDIAARLRDAIEALDGVARRTSGITRTQFDADEDLQLIIERLLITVGEALSEAENVNPELYKRVPNIRSVVGTRNRIVHNYWNVDPNVLWDVTVVKGAQLRESLQDLLDEYS
jgi:uncharacterized protein with HEPN domain